MPEKLNPASSFTLPGSSLNVNRMGYGAMQLAGRDGKKQRSVSCEKLSPAA
jgi:hypothetical protein